MSSLLDVLNARKANGDGGGGGQPRSMGTLNREGIHASSSARMISSNASIGNQPSLQTQRLRHVAAVLSGIDTTSRWNLPKRDQWIELGEGWFQTNHDSGNISRCGLHSVVESNNSRLLTCMYVPRSKAAYQAIHGDNPEFDLELSLKFLQRDASSSGGSSVVASSSGSVCSSSSSSVSSTGIPYVIFAMKSSDDFYALKCDVSKKIWLLVHIRRGEEHPMNHAVDESMRCNLFYSVLVQIRGSSVSVDVNGIPLFTATRCSADSKEFNGLVGLAVHNGKFALKGWKLKGQVQRPNNPPRYSAPIQTTEEIQGGGLMQERASYNSQSNTSAATLSSAPMPVQVGLSNDSDENKRSMQIRRQIEMQLGDSFEKCIVDCVLSDLISVDVGVTFDDIASLQDAKRVLHEAIILPTIVPEFFTGIREPWKGVLLYGPPGTGKTMLAKGICSFNKATFFNCSASSLISKFRGDSEKIVRCLFTAARIVAPSVIFIDEIDAIASSRSSDFEHEASRRMKTELFAQIDGLTSKLAGNTGIVVLAATNIPWDLDLAMIRRLEKRIYIPLPDYVARQHLFTLFLRGMVLHSDVNIDELARLTDGYSGADIQILCRDASMMPMRRLLDICSIQDIEVMKNEGRLGNPKIAAADFMTALQNTRKTVPQNVLSRYAAWEQQSGSK